VISPVFNTLKIRSTGKFFAYTLLLIAFPKQFYAQEKTNDSLRTIIRNSAPDTNKIRALNELAMNLYKTNPDTAVILSSQALDLSENKNWTKGKATSIHQLGVFAFMQSKQTLAIENYFKALDIWDSKTLWLNQNTSITEIKTGKSKTLGNLGVLYTDQGNFVKALEFLLKALKISEELNDKKSIASKLTNIGNLYASHGDHTKALEVFLRGLKLNIEMNNEKKIGSSYNNIGSIYYALKKYDKAYEYFINSYKINEKINNHLGLAHDLTNLGTLYSDQNKYPESMDNYMRALKIEEEKGNDYGISIIKGNIGRCYLKQKKYKEAEPFLLEAVDISLKVKNIVILKDHYDNLYQLYSGKREFEKSLKIYNKFIKIKDSLFNIERNKDLTRYEMNYEFDKKQAALKAEQDKKDAVTAEKSRAQKMIIYFVSFGLLFVALLAMMIFRGYRVKKRTSLLLTEKNAMIREKNKAITEKQKEIVDSINYAKRIQYTLLAHDSFLKENLNEHFVLFNPKDIVSGDFYWAAKHNNRFYLAVCDSTGHGVPGAFMSLLSMGFLSETINEKEILEPDEIFNYVRKRLIENISKEGQRDGFDGILLCIDKTNNKISFASGNNAPILIKGNELTELYSDRMPVGLGERKEPFRLNTIDFKPGSTLYLYTDGYADQFGGPKGKKFKYKQLNELLLSVHKKPMNEQHEILNDRFNNWKGSLEQVDDVCIIGLRL